MLLNGVVRQMNERVGYIVQVEFAAARSHVAIMIGEPLKASIYRR